MRKRTPFQFELPLTERSREPLARAHIALDGRLVEYTLRRSRRRRSITLTIDERGLRVGAPWQAAEHAIERELRRHGDWVLKKLAEWSERRPARRLWQDGETIMLHGAPLRLTVLGAPHAPERRDDRLVVGGADVEAAVTGWLRERALTCFRERVAQHAPLLAVPAPPIRLSNARTRWGSCHPAGYIHLNWRLIHFPPALIDYVVVHELAHLRELNHSARFWRLVAQLIPDHTVRRAEMRTCAHLYLAA